MQDLQQGFKKALQNVKRPIALSKALKGPKNIKKGFRSASKGLQKGFRRTSKEPSKTSRASEGLQRPSKGLQTLQSPARPCKTLQTLQDLKRHMGLCQSSMGLVRPFKALHDPLC
jgi:hypothetical protein